MKLMRLLLLCFVALFILFHASPALAQAVVASAPPVVLSSPTIVVTILSLVLGFVNQGINTGSILGIKTVPKAWLPYLTIVVTFGGAFVTQLATYNSLAAQAVLVAIFAGISALLAAGGGSALQNHLKAHIAPKTVIVNATTPPAP